MRKQLTTITLGILMISLASAMYAGESYSFQTNLTNPVYTVTGNSYNLDGLTVEFENGSITISTLSNYKPDNFTLIFFDNITNEVEKIVYTGGGGGSKTKYVDNNVTVYVPEYVETIKEINVTRVEEVKVIKYQDNPFNIVKSIGLFLIGLVFGLIALLIYMEIKGK